MLLWLCMLVCAQSAEAREVKSAHQREHVTFTAQHPRKEALISSERHVPRLANQRPQRLAPWGQQGSQRQTHTPSPYHYSPSKSLHSDFHTGRRPTAPAMSTAATDYYVIALRHLRC